MKINKSKIGLKELLGVLFIAIVIGAMLGFDMIVTYFNQGNPEIEKSRQATKELSELLIQIDKIDFNTTVLDNEYFQNLKTIPFFPLETGDQFFGKKNPFVGSFVVAPTPVASTTVGGVVYSTQRGDGETAVRTVKTTTTPTRTPPVRRRP